MRPEAPPLPAVLALLQFMFGFTYEECFNLPPRAPPPSSSSLLHRLLAPVRFSHHAARDLYLPSAALLAVSIC